MQSTCSQLDETKLYYKVGNGSLEGAGIGLGIQVVKPILFTMDDLKVGILVVSDRCFSGTSKDESGVAIEAIVLEKLSSSAAITTKIVPDEQDQIKAALLAWVEEGISLILTTGGTGFAPRDVTPEATREVIEKEAPGLTVKPFKTPPSLIIRCV